MPNKIVAAPLPAIFKKINSGDAWCCAVQNCKGVMGHVHQPGFDMNPHIELRLGYAKHKGVYQRTLRASSRNKDIGPSKEKVKQWSQAVMEIKCNLLQPTHR